MPGPNISICYETFSLPLAMAAKIQREQLPDSKFYERILAAVEKEEARQESFTVLRTRSGQKAETESIIECQYPTNYESAKVGKSANNVTVSPGTDAAPGTEKASGARTPATPKNFETKNIGNTLELEPNLSEDEKFVDLRLLPEHETLGGKISWGQEFSTAELPEFEIQRINTSATLRINQPFLLGTYSRPPVSKVDPDSANRVWFAFVTATLAKP